MIRKDYSIRQIIRDFHEKEIISIKTFIQVGLCSVKRVYWSSLKNVPSSQLIVKIMVNEDTPELNKTRTILEEKDTLTMIVKL